MVTTVMIACLASVSLYVLSPAIYPMLGAKHHPLRDIPAQDYARWFKKPATKKGKKK